ncbi:hypothetical protein [Allorhizocola rhizosphaerae]|uniref:hypothetical protein n=1 Tax=Allorhizocola rhizosphaerae TaxID=1872709 RepID=UPI000E3CAE74|nr:hypothetical protein [Allorhizocola rhizosphaerae]
MLIPNAVLAGIRAGAVTLAFRRWERPRVLPGTKMRTMIGLVEITSVDAIALRDLTAGEAKAAGFATLAELRAFLAGRDKGRVFRIGLRHAGADPRIELRESTDIDGVAERVRAMGPWAEQFLRMIAEQPGVRAPDLAASIGWERDRFKRYVRRLKELGLTESLEVGYRVSPRGKAVLRKIRISDAKANGPR